MWINDLWYTVCDNVDKENTMYVCKTKKLKINSEQKSSTWKKGRQRFQEQRISNYTYNTGGLSYFRTCSLYWLVCIVLLLHTTVFTCQFSILTKSTTFTFIQTQFCYRCILYYCRFCFLCFRYSRYSSSSYS